MDRISAFMDGETSRIEAKQAILRLHQEDDCRVSWETFHLISDVMRGDSILRDDFTARLAARLEQEPTVLSPRPLLGGKIPRYALSAAASLAAVAVVLTLVLTDNPLNTTHPQTASLMAGMPQAQMASIVPQPVSAAYRNRVNEFLMAHQEFSPSTALQGVAPYVRTVSAARDSNN